MLEQHPKDPAERHLIIILTFILLLFSLSSCSDTQTRVGLVLYNESDPFVYNYARSIEEHAQGVFSLSRADSGNSQILQNEQIAQMLDQKLDLLIINPVDRLSVYSIIKRQREMDIPVIFFNREPLLKDLDLWEDAYYVGAKAEQSGRLQAELIMELLGNDPRQLNRFDKNGDNVIQAIILKGEQGHQDAEIRTSEVLRIFHDQGYAMEAVIEVANWESTQAYEKMEQIAKTFGTDFEVIISNNDAMAIGAIKRMKEAGFFTDTNGNGRIDPLDELWVPIVGIDGISEAVELIEYGYLYGTVLNDSNSQAQAVVELSEYLLGLRKEQEMTYRLLDDTYVWIDYKVFTLD
ncbi:MAG: galactose ABC transporter substrate-binding protein [Spirochaetia bacterium]|nr:galactose ABC transporter substrate-binding protein [Spirochaetia bacterium]